jgi:hypothetical protein
MDLIRFAETYGHEQDYPIAHAWRYRDYLIRAFNEDVPYDQFVAEHIAGDLLPEPRRATDGGWNESVIATGFWYLHQATHSPVDLLQDEADRIDNQVDVFSKTFLGLTVSCARCHHHKFDAISMEDYYGLTAFLRGSRQDVARLDPEGAGLLAVALGGALARASGRMDPEAAGAEMVAALLDAAPDPSQPSLLGIDDADPVTVLARKARLSLGRSNPPGRDLARLASAARRCS